MGRARSASIDRAVRRLAQPFPDFSSRGCGELYPMWTRNGTTTGNLRSKCAMSRTVSVIDAHDAMVSNRCYRKGLPHAEAIRRLF